MSVNKSSGVEGDKSRLTIDISKNIHKRLKMIAALQGKSMREYVSELIEKEVYSEKIPNKETLKAISDVKKRKGLIKAKDVNDLFDKLGI